MFWYSELLKTGYDKIRTRNKTPEYRKFRQKNQFPAEIAILRKKYGCKITLKILSGSTFLANSGNSGINNFISSRKIRKKGISDLSYVNVTKKGTAGNLWIFDKWPNIKFWITYFYFKFYRNVSLIIMHNFM